MKENLINGLYVLFGNTIVKYHAHYIKEQDNAKLWHLRLGHISDRGLQ